MPTSNEPEAVPLCECGHAMHHHLEEFGCQLPTCHCMKYRHAPASLPAVAKTNHSEIPYSSLLPAPAPPPDAGSDPKLQEAIERLREYSDFPKCSHGKVAAPFIKIVLQALHPLTTKEPHDVRDT